MQLKTEARPLLLPEWAFVVQFRVGMDMEHGQLDGRVEHVVSGQATRFQGKVPDLLIKREKPVIVTDGE